MTGSPGEEFDFAVRRGREARRLEREGLDLELGQKDYEAIDKYSQALELNPRDGSVRRSLASLRTRLGIQYAGNRSFIAAHQNFRAAVDVDTTFAHAFANLGSFLLFSETGPTEYALSATHEALVLQPDDDLSWAQMGYVLRKQGKYAEAIPYFERALSLNPQNVEAGIGYVDSIAEAEENPDYAALVSYLESLLELEPENAEIMIRIGKYRGAVPQGAAVAKDVADSAAAIPE
jgi:tetratricopeptide (TPR) repeat protein